MLSPRARGARWVCGWWQRVRSFLGLGKGGVGAAGWSGAAGTLAGGPRTTRSSLWGIKPQKDERVVSVLGFDQVWPPPGPGRRRPRRALAPAALTSPRAARTGERSTELAAPGGRWLVAEGAVAVLNRDLRLVGGQRATGMDRGQRNRRSNASLARREGAEATRRRCAASRTRCRARCGGCGPSTSRASAGPR
jgi:hypothetical protein